MCLNVFKMIQQTSKESLTGWKQQGASVKICSNTKHQISNCCCCLLDPTTGDLNAPAHSDTWQSPDLNPLRHEPDPTSLTVSERDRIPGGRTWSRPHTFGHMVYLLCEKLSVCCWDQTCDSVFPKCFQEMILLLNLLLLIWTCWLKGNCTAVYERRVNVNVHFDLTH